MKNKSEYIKFILPLLIIFFWFIFTYTGKVPPTSLPSLSAVKDTFIEMLKSGQLSNDLSLSLRRVLAGFFISSVLGISLGIFMGISSKAKEFFQLTLTAIRQIPMIAWIPLIILWAGIGEVSKIVVILFAATFPIVVNTMGGVDSTSETYLEVAKMYGLSKKDTFFKVYLPSALPNIFTGLRLGLGASWMAVVASELIASSSGIGYRLNDARSLMRSDVVIVCMIIIGLVGLLMDKLIVLISHENIIKIKNISKKFQKNNEEVQILNDVNLDIKKGEFITIVGKSGCGKSTLLKLISGMVPITEGEILINGKSVNGVSKDCSMIFQDARLFPWLKIKDNVAIGLKNISSEEKNRIVLEYLELVGLKGVENSYPDQLSGGMAQRASIARGLALNSQIMLFDEPFSALDAMTKVQLQEELLKIHQEKGKTVILVTHDIEEAVYLGDRVVVMAANPGVIKDIINIDIEGRKDRTNTEFLSYKNKIYDYFFEDRNKNAVEYNI